MPIIWPTSGISQSHTTMCMSSLEVPDPSTQPSAGRFEMRKAEHTSRKCRNPIGNCGVSWERLLFRPQLSRSIRHGIAGSSNSLRTQLTDLETEHRELTQK